MEEFNLITGLEIKHEYWNVTTPALFDIGFSPDTLTLVKKLKIQTRQIENTLHLLGHAKAVQYLSKDTEKESFNMYLTLRDRNLVNYTDITQSNDDHVLHFSNKAGTPELADSIITLPIQRSLAEVFAKNPNATLMDDSGSNILDDLLVDPKEPAFARALNAMKEGVYSSSDESVGSFYYQPKLIKGLFAVVNLKADQIKNSGLYQLNLKSRSVRLAYRIKSAQYDLDKLKLVDAAAAVNFESDVREDEVVFTSDQAVKLTEKPDYNFQLINGTKKPIRENMSIGSTNNFKRYNQDGNQFLNEILINI